MRKSGFTIVELMLGMAVIGTMMLVLTQAFTIGLRSHRLISSDAFVLANARKALNGEGAFNGMLGDIVQAQAVLSLSTSTLSVLGITGSTTTYTMDSVGALRVTRGTTTATMGRGFTEFKPEYYSLNSDFALVAATAATNVRFATITLTVQEGKRSLRFFSGARVRNLE